MVRQLPTTVVIPTIGRASLAVTLRALADGVGPYPQEVIVVDDRPSGQPLDPALFEVGLPSLRVVRSGGGGPAKARNLGWRLARTPWVSFLDDDVVPDADWRERLADDIDRLTGDVAATQGRVQVPLPTARRPTDWEHSTAGLATAPWITADMTYRRSALSAVGGFDERFPRAFREDSDLALRVQAAGGRLVVGARGVTHPVRPAGYFASVSQQAGNADDMLMRRLHGPRWREVAGAGRGRRRRHVLVTSCGLVAVALGLTGRPRFSALAAAGWLAGLVEFIAARVAPGPRTPVEVLRMATTSTAIPAVATWHTARGLWRHRAAQPWRGLPDLVLFDRDGTLVHDVPYNNDAARVVVVEQAPEALSRLRRAGVRVGIITNQSGVASGVISPDDLDAVHGRVEELLGPFDVLEVCPHGRDDGCECRKPAPGMVKRACRTVDVDPSRCVVVGDIGSDVEAAEAAGAVGILVPTAATRIEEIDAARRVCPDLDAAMDTIFGGRW